MTFTMSEEIRHALNYAEQMQRALQVEKDIKEMSGPDCIAYLLNVGIWTQADLARNSGMTAATITAIKKGKKPNAAQRAAFCWAIAKR